LTVCARLFERVPLKVSLGKFARTGIETQAAGDLSAGVRAALRHYVQPLVRGEEPVGLPPFDCEGSEGTSAHLRFELQIDPEIERTLEEECARQETTLETLLNHAVFIYLATVDELGAVGAVPLTA
jgi:hypothetical protein